jgi:hypothetical protein
MPDWALVLLVLLYGVYLCIKGEIDRKRRQQRWDHLLWKETKDK